MNRIPDQQAYLFDLDGTLLDSMGVWRQIDLDFLSSRGLPITPDYAQAIAPLGFDGAARYTIERFGLSQTPEEIMTEWYEMAKEQYAHRLFLKPGAAAYLAALRAKKKPVALVTANNPELYLPALEKNGVRGCFDTFVSVADVPRGKGFPDIYLEAARRLSVEPEHCAVFEDITQGVVGAKAASCFAVAVYDEHNKENWEQTASLADASILSFSELL